MYTRSTMVGEELNNSDDAFATAELGSSSYLMCIAEHSAAFPTTNHRKTKISIVAVSLATGEIVFDEFEDDTDRSNLATRVTHIQPAEVLVSVDVSARTRGFLKHLAVRGDHPPRVEVLCPTVFDKRPDVIAETLDTLGARDRSQGACSCCVVGTSGCRAWGGEGVCVHVFAVPFWCALALPPPCHHGTTHSRVRIGMRSCTTVGVLVPAAYRPLHWFPEQQPDSMDSKRC
eukprot:m.1278691 g.1278691  ORF g.1278691 m.1278691 type:complete len:231 (-) comp24765_c0_seq10:2418-3110(-)